MVTDPEEFQKIELELAKAHRARMIGNEGWARVCARRAAGWAVGRAWAARRGTPVSVSAYSRLLWLSASIDVPEAIRQAAYRLTVRVGPDQRLPHEQDPLDDAQAVEAWCRMDRRRESQP